MAVLKTRWKAPLPPKKEEVKKVPEKKVVKKEPVIEAPIVEKPIDDPTAEEFIATLPKKQQRGSKKVIKIIEE